MFNENSKGFLIKTPTGYEKFKGVQKKLVDKMITISFTDCSSIKCSGKHAFKLGSDLVVAENIIIGDILNGREVCGLKVEHGVFEVFDPVGVENHSLYYSNGVISHNTEFIGSSATLVSGSKLRTLAFHNPLLSEDGFDTYQQPIKGHLYVCTVDCAEGVGLDSSTINVIDVTCLPYIQVAKYKSNTLPLLFFPTTIFSVATKYNDAFVLIENNSIGQQVVDILHYDLEYDNIFKSETHRIKGQTVSPGFKRSTTIGIRTTKSVKKIGCANLKTLIENDKLVINDFDTIAELNSFIRTRDSYAADEGNNDDLVMGLVLFGWLSAQSYFRDTGTIDIRKILLEEHDLFMDENLAPVGFIDDGRMEDITIDGSDMWVVGDPTVLTF